MGKLSRKIQKSFLYLMRVLPLWFTQADYSLNKQGVDVGKKYQEQESAPLVREFLADTGMTAAQIERVAYLVGHH